MHIFCLKCCHPLYLYFLALIEDLTGDSLWWSWNPPSVLYKCIFSSGFRRQNIERLMVTLNTFPQQESDKSEISRSVGTLIMAGLLQKCTVGEPNLIFFFSVPLALFSNNYSSKKHLEACFSSKGFADFISFFWDYKIIGAIIRLVTVPVPQ